MKRKQKQICLFIKLFYVVLTAIVIVGGKHDVLARAFIPNPIISPLPEQAAESAVLRVATPTPTPIPLTWKETAQMIIEEWQDLGKYRVFEALSVAFCESKWEEKAQNLNKNGTDDAGVFQLNSIHRLPDTIRWNSRENIKWAKAKFIKDGYSWGAWACKP